MRVPRNDLTCRSAIPFPVIPFLEYALGDLRLLVVWLPKIVGNAPGILNRLPPLYPRLFVVPEVAARHLLQLLNYEAAVVVPNLRPDPPDRQGHSLAVTQCDQRTECVRQSVEFARFQRRLKRWDRPFETKPSEGVTSVGVIPI